jgi:hypothetical protein
VTPTNAPGEGALVVQICDLERCIAGMTPTTRAEYDTQLAAIEAAEFGTDDGLVELA